MIKAELIELLNAVHLRVARNLFQPWVVLDPVGPNLIARVVVRDGVIRPILPTLGPLGGADAFFRFTSNAPRQPNIIFDGVVRVQHTRHHVQDVAFSERAHGIAFGGHVVANVPPQLGVDPFVDGDVSAVLVHVALGDRALFCSQTWILQQRFITIQTIGRQSGLQRLKRRFNFIGEPIAAAWLDDVLQRPGVFIALAQRVVSRFIGHLRCCAIDRAPGGRRRHVIGQLCRAILRAGPGSWEVRQDRVRQ